MNKCKECGQEFGVLIMQDDYTLLCYDCDKAKRELSPPAEKGLEVKDIWLV